MERQTGTYYSVDDTGSAILWDLDSASLILPECYRREISQESGYQTSLEHEVLLPLPRQHQDHVQDWNYQIWDQSQVIQSNPIWFQQSVATGASVSFQAIVPTSVPASLSVGFAASAATSVQTSVSTSVSVNASRQTETIAAQTCSRYGDGTGRMRRTSSSSDDSSLSNVSVPSGIKETQTYD